MEALATFPPGPHSDACKGLYLRGILDCGYNKEDLSHFFVEERKVDLASFTFEQVSDVGLDFVTVHKTDREAKLEETVESQNAEIAKMRESMREMSDQMDKNCKDAYFAAFFEGSGLNPADFDQYLREVTTRTIDVMAVEELIEHLKQFKSAVAMHRWTAQKSQFSSVGESGCTRPVEASVVSVAYTEEPESQSVYVLSATQLPVTQLGVEAEVHIEVSECVVSREEVERGFLFFSDTYSYKITTRNFNWTVRRTQEDFAWLRKVLSSSFPGYITPPTPKIKRDSVNYMTHLKRFLDALMAVDVFKSSPLLRTFLKEDDIAVSKAVLEAMRQPIRAQDMYSVNGTIKCDLDQSSDSINWLNDYLLRDEAAKNKLEEMIQSVKGRLKDLSSDLKGCAACMFYLSNLQATMPVCLPLSDLYTDLGKTLDTWANFENDFVWVFDTYLSSFLQQETEDLESIKDLVPLRTQWLEAYQESGSDQHRDLFAYFNRQCQTERDRVLRYQVFLFVKNFQEMATITLKKIADLSQKWEEFRTIRKT